MNQILVSKFENKKRSKKKIFKFQMIISIIIAIVLYIETLIDNYNIEKMQVVTQNIKKSLKVSEIYNVKKEIKEENIYLGKIEIPKIKLEYPILNNCNEELMKISVCKFYGTGIGEKGNICIVGHNYNDKRFFGRLFELEKNDVIKLINLDEKVYIYKIYEIYETDEKDLSCLKNKKEYELTLVTCNNGNKKRRIIKATYDKIE